MSDQNLVDILNQAFPDTQSLEQRLPEAVDYARLCQSYLEAQLSSRPDSSKARSLAIDASKRLSHLRSQAAEVQELGQTSLDKVNEVTAGIKRLDRVKDNLSRTVRMLRQLRMLGKLYTQLESLLKARHYGELANAVTATTDLVEYFRPFRTVPRIAQLSQQISELQSQMYAQIQDEFNSAMSQPHMAKEAAHLREASEVIDALDTNQPNRINREKLVQWYSQAMLREYFTIFAVADEAGSLDNVRRRYTYLRNKVLAVYDEVHSQWFPLDWKVRDALLGTAVDRTAQDLELHCERLSSANEQDMQSLVTALQETVDFERAAKCPEPIISTEMDKFISLWVDFQDRQLMSRIQSYKILAGSSAAGKVDEGGVLPSSKELVNFLRVLLAQLQKLTRNSQVIGSLYEVLAKWLGRYGQAVLITQLPQGHFARSSVELAMVGAVAVTAQYLLTTVNQLEEQAPEGAKDRFNELARQPLFPVVNRAVDLVVGYVDHRLEPCWRDMELIQAWAMPGNVSDYAVRLGSVLSQSVTDALVVVPTPGMTYDVCNRIVETVCLSFLTTGIARTPRPVTEAAAEQMLFDLYSIKTKLIKLLELAPADVREAQRLRTSSRLKRFPERTQETVGQAEAILKVLMTPPDPVGDFVENYIVLVKDSNAHNFRKLLEVKNARQQHKAVDIFRSRLGQTQPGEVTESVLLSQLSLMPPKSTTQETSSGPALVQSFRKFIQRRDN